MPYLRPKRRTSFPINIWPGKGERGQESQTEGARGLGLFALPGQSGSSRAQLTTGTDRLISTWSCRNPIRGLRSVGQPRHVNLFSMCAARRSQTTGAQEARPQPQPQPQPRSSGGVNKELKASKCIELARGSGPAASGRAGEAACGRRRSRPAAQGIACSEPGARASGAPAGRAPIERGRVGKRRGGEEGNEGLAISNIFN